MKLDILAIGAHPDDVELGCGGTLIKHINEGYRVGIIDLTQGELGTRGDVKMRLQEAKNAARVMGAKVRENLGFADGFFLNDKKHQLELISIIRKYQPTVVITNATFDRHPDHGRSASLTYDSCFLSGLAKIKSKSGGKTQEAFRPRALYHYIQALHIKPDFVVDITKYFDKKVEAVRAHRSQFFDPNSKEPETFISSPQFLEYVEARAKHFGMPINAKYAEGFTVNRTPGVDDVVKLG